MPPSHSEASPGNGGLPMTTTTPGALPPGSNLLLPPVSPAAARRWVLSTTEATQLVTPGTITIILPASQRGFGSIAPILDLVADDPGSSSDFTRLLGHLDQVATAAHSATADGPTLALRRRVSRESGPATRVFELGARLVIDALQQRGSKTRVDIHGVDEADSLTLRLLARAAVLLPSDSEACFVWHGTSDPTAVPLAEASNADLARSAIVASIANSAVFTIERPLGWRAESPGAAGEGPGTIGAAEAELVAHNYDGALTIAAQLISANIEPARAHRVNALALVNLGDPDGAAQALVRALAADPRHGQGPHVHCLLALIAAKRSQDVAASDRHIQDGLDLLQELATDGVGDPALERAWLLNASALNRAYEFRGGDPAAWNRALELEQEAFALVREGTSDERAYLRFNLLANIAFLFQMRGDRTTALRVFEGVFSSKTSGDPVADVFLRYRIGVLQLEAGDLAAAERSLCAIDPNMLPIEEWAAVEHLFRARGVLAAQRGDHRVAAEAFSRGLVTATEARARRAAIFHLRGLLVAHEAAGNIDAAFDAERQLASLVSADHPEGVPQEWHTELPRLSPKLPAYLPEVDLEELPIRDTNSLLAGARS